MRQRPIRGHRRGVIWFLRCRIGLLHPHRFWDLVEVVVIVVVVVVGLVVEWGQVSEWVLVPVVETDIRRCFVFLYTLSVCVCFVRAVVNFYGVIEQ